MHEEKEYVLSHFNLNLIFTVIIKRKWPEEKLMVGIESLRNFNVRAKVVGPSGLFVKYIQQETQTRVQIKGIGSGFIDQETGRESDEPMHIHITYVVHLVLLACSSCQMYTLADPTKVKLLVRKL